MKRLSELLLPVSLPVLLPVPLCCDLPLAHGDLLRSPAGLPAGSPAGRNVGQPNPAERAAELTRARGGDFREEVEAHLLHGVVISTPALFLMARPVRRDADVRDVWETFDAPDAWFVWCAVGDMRAALAAMPYPLTWVGWCRQGRGWARNHWVRTEALLRRVSPSAL